MGEYLWETKTRQYFVQALEAQYALLKEVPQADKIIHAKPEYLFVNDIFKSHIIRQRDFAKRQQLLLPTAKYTLENILQELGEQKLSDLMGKGLFPREPAPGFVYFAYELTHSLGAPDLTAIYILNFRSAIGCCDDYIDKDRYYNVYGDSLHLISHFMLDIGELALHKTGKLSGEICDNISKLNIKLIKDFQTGEKEQSIFKKSYPQGKTFARIASHFGNKPLDFIDGVSEAAGHYDYAAHISGELLDAHNGEKNCLGTDAQSARQRIFEALDKALAVCPECSLKEMLTSERELTTELFRLPGEFEELATKRKQHRIFPNTQLMKLKNKPISSQKEL
jgi:hypothetical protein